MSQQPINPLPHQLHPPSQIDINPSLPTNAEQRKAPSGELALAFPVPTTWLCGNCDTTHPVLSLLTQPHTECTCGTPSLRAVYDQTGRLYLYWRDDPTVADLRQMEQVRIARERMVTAGAGIWLQEKHDGTPSMAMPSPQETSEAHSLVWRIEKRLGSWLKDGSRFVHEWEGRIRHQPS
ncbi:uncharacterized protein CTHT_0035770 [Thermochaetoides thermophila DSM 1495]|uniref:Uncharacterized protein n=1 Tax=Chaetomium thermophilum (strain DSM 1495 / CBS 144.50 / IMI 039719) TaxID=759272 RepID=G0S712_CHATD|nr:hypothetical protein CTHT_0035770 [Thermochaetoides thermophila DSM 1495]EGS21710.1 hypothetical protein CTHT_0035770 [Thermochaetoides thermophila DSM 1495]